MKSEEIMDRQRKDIRLKHSLYHKDLTNYRDGITNSFDSAERSGHDFFNYLEEVVSQNDSIDTLQESSWNQWLAETCLNVLYDIHDHFDILSFIYGNNYQKPSPTAFAAMQRTCRKHFGAKKTKEIQDKFSKAGLPIFGFKNRGLIEMKKIGLGVGVVIVSILIFLSALFLKDEIPIPLIVGLCFCSLVFISCLVIKKPSGMQYFILRTLFSISIPGLLVSYPGFIELTFKKYGFEITAFGLFAVFFIIYKLNPAKLSELDE